MKRYNKYIYMLLAISSLWSFSLFGHPSNATESYSYELFGGPTEGTSLYIPPYEDNTVSIDVFSEEAPPPAPPIQEYDQSAASSQGLEYYQAIYDQGWLEWFQTVGSQIWEQGGIFADGEGWLSLLLRANYVEEVKALKKDYEPLKKAALMIGDPVQRERRMEEIARQAYQDRRDIGLRYKAMTPMIYREYKIKPRNVNLYEDPLGPSIEWKRKQINKRTKKPYTWEDIIDSAARPGGGWSEKIFEHLGNTMKALGSVNRRINELWATYSNIHPLIAEEYSAEDLDSFLRNNPGKLNVRDSGGDTPLITAVKAGLNDHAGVLLDYDATEVDFRDRNGANALMHAAYLGDPAMVAMLLDAGVNMYAIDDNADNVLHYLVEGNVGIPEYAKIIELFRARAEADDVPFSWFTNIKNDAGERPHENARYPLIGQDLEVSFDEAA